jgi:hypothetical protein
MRRILKHDHARTRVFLEDGESVVYKGRQVRAFTPLKERPCPSRPPGMDNYWRMFSDKDEKKRKREEKKGRRMKRRDLLLLRMEAEREKKRAEEDFFVSLKQLLQEEEEE